MGRSFDLVPEVGEAVLFRQFIRVDGQGGYHRPAEEPIETIRSKIGNQEGCSWLQGIVDRLSYRTQDKAFIQLYVGLPLLAGGDAVFVVEGDTVFVIE